MHGSEVDADCFRNILCYQRAPICIVLRDAAPLHSTTAQRTAVVTHFKGAAKSHTTHATFAALCHGCFTLPELLGDQKLELFRL